MEESIEQRLVALLVEKNMTLSTAESCTGGMLSAMIASVPGVSAVFAGGAVTYNALMKHKILGVSKKVLKEQGAISKKTAKQMASGANLEFGTDCALSVTGNAGPSADEGKPVGLVYIGCSIDDKTVAHKYIFEGDRQQIRRQAAEAAMQLLYDRLSDKCRNKSSLKAENNTAADYSADEGEPVEETD